MYPCNCDLVSPQGCLVSCDVRSEPMCQSECCMAFAEKVLRPNHARPVVRVFQRSISSRSVNYWR